MKTLLNSLVLSRKKSEIMPAQILVLNKIQYKTNCLDNKHYCCFQFTLLPLLMKKRAAIIYIHTRIMNKRNQGGTSVQKRDQTLFDANFLKKIARFSLLFRRSIHKLPKNTKSLQIIYTEFTILFGICSFFSYENWLLLLLAQLVFASLSRFFTLLKVGAENEAKVNFSSAVAGRKKSLRRRLFV